MKQPFLFTILALALGLFTFISCTEDDTEPEALITASDYFPLAIGNFTEYRLDSTIFSPIDNNSKTNKYFVRNEVTGSIIDGEGDTLYEISRFIKPEDGSAEYKFEYKHYAKENLGRVEEIENQLRFVSLISPIQVEKTWKGNEFITKQDGDDPNSSNFFYQDWDYTYMSVNEQLSLPQVNVNNVLHVNQVNKPGGPGAVNHFISDAYYAKNIGLVKKRLEAVVENCGAAGCSEKNLPILERTKGKKGFIVDMELVDFRIQ